MNFQPMPELSAAEFDALRADIATNGVMVPVVTDQHGRIVDGNHRAAIAAELGIDYPTVVVQVADDNDAMDRAVSLNCSRRHLNREQVRSIVAAEIDRRPGDSDRAIARRVGCSPTTVGTVRAHIRAAAGELTEADARRLTDELKGYMELWGGQTAMTAVTAHRGLMGMSWRRIADVMERAEREAMHEAMSKLDTLPPDDDLETVFDALFGSTFAEMREYVCEGRCEVCEASKLDTPAVSHD